MDNTIERCTTVTTTSGSASPMLPPKLPNISPRLPTSSTRSGVPKGASKEHEWATRLVLNTLEMRRARDALRQIELEQCRLSGLPPSTVGGSDPCFCDDFAKKHLAQHAVLASEWPDYTAFADAQADKAAERAASCKVSGVHAPQQQPAAPQPQFVPAAELQAEMEAARKRERDLQFQALHAWDEQFGGAPSFASPLRTTHAAAHSFFSPSPGKSHLSEGWQEPRRLTESEASTSASLSSSDQDDDDDDKEAATKLAHLAGARRKRDADDDAPTGERRRKRAAGGCDGGIGGSHAWVKEEVPRPRAHQEGSWLLKGDTVMPLDTNLKYDGFLKDGVTYRVGDCVVLKSEDGFPHVCRIVNFWYPARASFRGQWFYRRSELQGQPPASIKEDSLLLTRHLDVNTIDSIIGKANVLFQLPNATQPPAPSNVPWTFHCRFNYNPVTFKYTKVTEVDVAALKFAKRGVGSGGLLAGDVAASTSCGGGRDKTGNKKGDKKKMPR